MRSRVNILTISLIVGASLSSGLMLRAQTWYGPAGPPPANLRCANADCSSTVAIENISGLGGDNLGLIGVSGSHQAQFNLDMSGYPIINAVSSSGDPAVDIDVTGNGTGLYVQATGGLALKAVSSFNQGAVLGKNLDSSATAYGLKATSGSGNVSAQLTGILALDSGQLILGSNVNDAFYLGSAGSAATGKLYYGSGLLCDNTDNCGFSSGVGAGDNLGRNALAVPPTLNPHTASKDLNMSAKSIYRIKSTSSNAALDVRGNATTAPYNNGATITNEMTAPAVAGVSAALYGSTSSANPLHAGVYAEHQGAYRGLLADSNSGQAALFYGQVQLAAASDGILFHDDTDLNLGRLAIQPSSNAQKDLYWGNKLLCDSSKTDCGWGGVNTEHWQQNSQFSLNIYYDQGNVGIGNSLPDHQLEVAGDTRTSLATIGSLYTSSVTSQGNLHVGNSAYIENNVVIDNAVGVASVGDVSLKTDKRLYLGLQFLTEADLDPDNPAGLVGKCKAAVGYCPCVKNNTCVAQ